jgi:hypothetical protein
MEAGHPFIDCSKMHQAKQQVPISSQPKPSMVRRSLHSEKAQSPIFLTPSIPCRVMMPDPQNAHSPMVVMAEPLRKLRLVRPLQPWNAPFLISVTPSAMVTSVTSTSPCHSPTMPYSSSVGSAPLYTTAFDMSEEQGGRVPRGSTLLSGRQAAALRGG